MYILCRISKGTLEIPQKVFYPYIEIHDFYLFKVEILRALRFKSS